MRRIRYQDIADDLRVEVRDAAPGSLLPSEAELSAPLRAPAGSRCAGRWSCSATTA